MIGWRLGCLSEPEGTLKSFFTRELYGRERKQWKPKRKRDPPRAFVKEDTTEEVGIQRNEELKHGRGTREHQWTLTEWGLVWTGMDWACFGSASLFAPPKAGSRGSPATLWATFLSRAGRGRTASWPSTQQWILSHARSFLLSSDRR